VRLLDVFAAKELRRFTGHTDRVLCVAFSPGGRLALSGSEDKTLRLWDVQSGKEVRPFLGHTDRIQSVAFSPDGRRIISASEDGTIRLWDVETGAEIRSFGKRRPVGAVAVFSPDGRQALSTHDDGLRLWNVETGEKIRWIADAAGYGLAVFTPDGHHAAVNGDIKGKWSLWDLDTGKEVRSYYLEWPFRPKAVQVSRDGRLAVCGNWRGSISIWRMGDPPPMGQELAEARRSYDQKRREQGPDAPETLQALDELAALHLDRDEPADAEALFRQGLQRKLRLYDGDHPATLAARKNLARVLTKQKKLAEAVALCRQCLEVYYHAQGPDHPDVLVAMDDLADALEAQGKPDEADAFWRQCVEGWERLLGPEHTQALAAANKLILKRRALGKPFEAEPSGLAMARTYAVLGEWDKALAGYGKAFKTASPKETLPWLEYACLLLQVGDTEGYRALCAAILKSFGQTENESDIHNLLCTCALAPRADPEAGRIAGLVKERIARARRGQLDGDPSFHVLALSCYRAGRYQQVIELLSASLKAQPDGWFDVANWLLMSLAEQHLGHAGKAQGWFSKADLWIKEEVLKRMGRPDNLTILLSVHWRDWLMIQLLHREAGALIRAKAAD
jgi:tetratricopeptide (TPR) repeat protein